MVLVIHLSVGQVDFFTKFDPCMMCVTMCTIDYYHMYRDINPIDTGAAALQVFYFKNNFFEVAPSFGYILNQLNFVLYHLATNCG